MPPDDGKLVAIDLDSGDFEIGTDELETIHRLRGRRPGATAFVFRVGSPHVHRIASRDVTPGTVAVAATRPLN